MKVLIVEDDPDLCAGLSRVIVSAGHCVEAVSNGRQAIERLSRACPDVVLTDWLMPDLDGMAVLRHTRGMVKRPRVLVLSGLRQSEAEAHALGAGAERFFSKPTPFAALLQAIQPTPVPEAPKPRVAVNDALERVVTSVLWKGFPLLAVDHMSACTSLRLRVAQGPRPTEELLSSRLGMLDPSNGIELHASVRCTRPSGCAIVKSALSLDSADRETIVEVLSELCNNLLGRAKRSLVDSGFDFTLSVPSMTDRNASPVYVGERSTLLEAGGVQLIAELGVRVATSSAVSPEALCENMVVVEDLMTESGALFIAAGTRITTTTAERISRRMPKCTLRVVLLS
jgi:CheY-like chemotaxis protein